MFQNDISAFGELIREHFMPRNVGPGGAYRLRAYWDAVKLKSNWERRYGWPHAVTAHCALDEMHKRAGLYVAHSIGLPQSCVGSGAGGQHHRIIQETALG
jgi:hypothetical protein